MPSTVCKLCEPGLQERGLDIARAGRIIAAQFFIRKPCGGERYEKHSGITGDDTLLAPGG
jgi:hypothetical protein